MLAGGFGRRMPVEEVPGSEMLQGRMVAFLGCSASTAHRRLMVPSGTCSWWWSQNYLISGHGLLEAVDAGFKSRNDHRLHRCHIGNLLKGLKHCHKVEMQVEARFLSVKKHP